MWIGGCHGYAGNRENCHCSVEVMVVSDHCSVAATVACTRAYIIDLVVGRSVAELVDYQLCEDQLACVE